MRKSGLCATFLLIAASCVQAAYWRCELPGGTYVVSLPTISSVSTHEYIVDGAARVTEVTIATSSSVVARFYYLDMLKPQSPIGIGQSVIDKAQEKLEEGIQRTGQGDLLYKVIKNYPSSTHAHTIEYRIDTLENLKKIFKSIESAWRANAETSIKIP